MAKQWFKIYVKFPGNLHEKSLTGFSGADAVQRQVMDLLKDGVPASDIKVLLDVPGTNPPDLTGQHVTRALKRLGRKVL